jgi:hypothetical protein
MSYDASDAYISAPKPVGRRTRKPGIDRKPRQAYSAKQLERLEAEFKVIMHRMLSSVKPQHIFRD